MSVRPANLRISKWIAKMSGEAVSIVTGKQLASMTEQIQQQFPDNELVENETKLILAEAGTSTIQNPSYLNFARQTRRCMQRFSGGQLLNAVSVIMNRWIAEGMDQDILEKIRNTVFAIAPPAP
jgi:hypothetical protein